MAGDGGALISQGVRERPAPAQRHRASVTGGVDGRSRILKSGWKAVKCTGTSGPSSAATHRVIASIS